MQNKLSIQQICEFEKNGFVVIENFWSQDIVKKLRDKIFEIIDGQDLSQNRSIFTTKEQSRTADDYFLTSAREVRFFWEEKAWSDGKLNVPSRVAINKIGHGLHDLITEFETVSYDKRIGSICKQLGLQKPLAAQSMYIFKQAFVGGEVGEHQDGTFIYTNPQSVIGFWWALDDCTMSNGCLWAVPESHKLGVSRRFRRKDSSQTGTEFVPEEPVVWDTSSAVPLEVSRGSLVILHGATVHFSRENTSPQPRHAYSVHVIEGAPGFEYPADNWLQRPIDQPFREIQSYDEAASDVLLSAS